MSLDSIPSSSDANCVCLPVSCARIWSIEMPASSSDSLVGGDTSVRNRVDALACVPPGRPAIGTQLRLLSTSSWSRNGASGAIVGMNSKAAPSAAGSQSFMIMPLGTYTAPKRLIGLAAVFSTAVRAGTIPSSSGNATVTPMPRSTVRRDIFFFVIIIGPVSSSVGDLRVNRRALDAILRGLLDHPHGERRAS